MSTSLLESEFENTIVTESLTKKNIKFRRYDYDY